MKASAVDVEGLSGTLLEPDGQGPFPLVLMIVGSGPNDRDGNALKMGLQTDAYRMLAEGLAQLGVASFRYDKRGIGASRALATSESELTFQAFVDDATRCLTWLARGSRFSRLVVCGHSEGSLIASLLPTWAGERVISLCGPGFSIAATLRRQLMASMSEALKSSAAAALDALDSGLPVPTLPSELAGVFRPSILPFLRSIWLLDPAELFQQRKGALLLVGGGRDIQITQADFERLRTTSPRAETAWFPNMSHVLKDAAGLPTRQPYTDPTLPLMDGLTARISAFVTT